MKIKDRLETLDVKKYKDFRYEDKLIDKNLYIKYLKESKDKKKSERQEIWKKYNRPYIDIDNEYLTKKRGRIIKDHSFYEDLCKYLNIQEKALNLENKWSYNFVLNKWIVVKNEKGEIHLRSDVFGFSVTQVEEKSDKYPYAKYFRNGGNAEDIATIIWNTRTLGGSFLWPVVLVKEKKRNVNKSVFNMQRGVGSYIDDRVDLTLYEVKYFYKLLNQNKIYREIKEDMNRGHFILLKNVDAKTIYEWLKHFKSFDNYVKFFSFQDFIKDNEIISLVNNKPIREPHKEKRIITLNNDELENVLVNVNNSIIKRTKRMVNIIKK